MRRPGRLALVATLALALAVAACGAYWWQLSRAHEQLRADSLAQVQRQSSQLAEAVAGETAILVELIDFAVQHLRDDYAAGDRKAFEGAVTTVLEVFPPGAVTQISVIDADGYLAYSNLGVKDRLHLGDREHFKTLAAAEGDRLVIGKPMRSRVSGAWSIPFARSFRRAGAFGGVVAVSVAPEYIAKALLQPDLGAQDVVAVFYTDGAYASRNLDLEGALGKSVPPERPFLGADAPAKGNFRVAAAFDKIHRTYAWRRVDACPLVINVGLAEAPMLGPVEQSIEDSRRRNFGGIVLVLMLATGLTLLLLQIDRQQQALRGSESRYRSFFEHNTSVKLLIDPADGRIVDANPAAIDFYGYPRERLLAMKIGDINCLPAEEVRQEMARATGEERQYFNFPHRLASGEIRQVEVYSGPMDVGGRTLLFSVIHDVTVRHELERKLRDSEELHRSLLESIAGGVLVVSTADGQITAWNDPALAILGVTADQLVGRELRLIRADGSSVPPEDFPSRRAARGEQLEHYLCGVERADGKRVWLSVSSRPLKREGEEPYAAVVSFADITALIEAEAAQRLAQSVFDAAGEGIVVTDAGNRIVAVNPAFTAITGYAAVEVIGRNPSLLSSGVHDADFYRILWQRLLADGYWEGEITNRRKDGQLYVEWLKMTAILDDAGRPRRYVALFSDVTERKRQEQVIWQKANFDGLTNLPNRGLLRDRLVRALAHANRKHSMVAVLFVDLDRFKPVNDLHGHAVGDELLRQAAQRLENALREEDTVARLGGDEFVVMLPDLMLGEAPVHAAEKIVSTLSAPFVIDGQVIRISCSIGIALFPRDAQDADGLINRADTAMYRAKQAGRATWSSV